MENNENVQESKEKVSESMELNKKEKKKATPGEIALGIVMVGFMILGPWIAISSILNRNNKTCYYLRDSITNELKDNVSLCIGDDYTTFKMNGREYDLYTTKSLDYIYIKNEYGSSVFTCTKSKNDASKIMCTSNDSSLGYGSYLFTEK